MENRQPTAGLVSLTWILYGLHAFSACTGMLSTAFVVTAFLTGWPSIIAVILGYVKRNEATGTYVRSHFDWLIRTFWFALLWLVLAGLLLVTVVGIPLAIVLLCLTGLWVLYRLVRGGLCLLDEKPVGALPAGTP